MRYSPFFYRLLSVLFALFLVVCGLFLAALPWAPRMLTKLLDWMQVHPIWWASLGTLFALFGAFLAINILGFQRRRNYKLRGGEQGVEISESVISGYVEAYWRERFPTADVATQVFINSHELQLHMDFPYVPFEEQEGLLKEAERALSERLERYVGYGREFQLSASFPEKPA